MNKKITAKSVVKFAGWAAIFATILLILMKLVLNVQIPMIQIISGFSSGAFCLYLGYLYEDSKK